MFTARGSEKRITVPVAAAELDELAAAMNAELARLGHSWRIHSWVTDGDSIWVWSVMAAASPAFKV